MKAFKETNIEQYINKAAVVAEIEKRIKTLDELFRRRPISWPTFEKLIEENKKVLSFIDTLEVKNVDLEKEMSKYLGDDWKKDADGKIENDMIEFAKHFFELGLKAAMKGE